MRILFLSHSYPPLIGGIENQNRDLSEGLKKIAKVKIIANSKGKHWLPFFVPVAFMKSLFLMTKYDTCLIGSGVLAPLGAVLRFFHPKKKFFSVVHGLDITYANKKGFLSKIYRNINIPSLKRLNQLFMVGNATIEEAVNVGIKRRQCTFIPNGVNTDKLKERHTRQELSKLFGKNTANKKVILRLGRFVPHKGTSWFIDNVMPKLSSEFVMIAAGNRVSKNTAGDQDDFIDCEQIIISNHLENRVKLLPCLQWKDVKTLLNTADLVVSPNIKIPGSMEGFGINIIEAQACERVVVGSNLEGIADAINDRKNGFLVEHENVEAWIKKINWIFKRSKKYRINFGKKAATYVQKHSSWDKICQRYLEEMKK